MQLVFRRHWAAIALFLVLTLALTNPLALHIWNAVEDKQDALLNTWIIAWVGHAAITDPFHLYNANIFYPYLNTLAFSEVLIPQGLLALPLTLATHNSILGYNSVLLSMFWLNAFGMYLLVVDWTGSRRAGWVAGAIYAFNPFNLGNLAQVQLVSLGWLPFAIIYLRRLLRREPGHGLRATFLFALFFVLQSLSSIYFALLAGLTVGLYVLYWLLSRIYTRWKHASYEIGLGGPLLRLCLGGLLIGAILTPLLLPYFTVQRELGFERKIEESEPFSASLRQFSEVSPENLVYGKWLAPNPVKYVGGYPLDNLFPGVLALVLAGIGLAQGRARSRWFLLALLVVSFVLALGPRLYLATGRPTDVTLPYRWLYDWFTPMRGLRAPVRFEALIMFALAGLAGMGVLAGQRHDRHARPDRVRSLLDRLDSLHLGGLVPFGLVLLIAGEYLAVPAANTTVLPVASQIPSVYQWLAQQPPGVALELPMMGPDAQKRLDISTEYFTTYHWHPTPDGYSGFVPGGRGGIAYEMQFFPDRRAISLMQALDVRYLVIHWDKLAEVGSLLQPSDLDQAPGLLPLQQGDEDSVYLVGPRIQMSTQMQHDLYVPQPVQSGAPFTAYVILRNTLSWPFAVKPTDRINWSASWSIGGTEKVTTAGPLVTSAASVIPVRLTAPMRRGKWWLELQATSDSFGSFPLKYEVQVGADPAAQETVIPASVQLLDPLAPSYAPGDTVSARLNWQALNKIDAYYSASVRIVDENGNKVAAQDREPRGETFLWFPGELLDDQFDLQLPTSLTPGKYRLQVFLYDTHSDASILMLDENYQPRETFTLGEFDVK